MKQISAKGSSLDSANGTSVNGTSIIVEIDVIVVGGGFAGCYLLHLLRKASFNAKVIEVGSDLGGVWHWSTYPGARADGQYPVYAYSLPEVYKTWSWTEEYPSSAEMRRYFAHVDDVLDLKRDVVFNTKAIAADFDAERDKWTVRCNDETAYRASWFIPCVGFTTKRNFPDWEGLDRFQGIIHHSSLWPSEGVNIKGKRIGVVGTGATGVQIIQEFAKEACELIVFQRTPNFACPMNQATITAEEQEKHKLDYPTMFQERLRHPSGFAYSNQKVNAFSHSPEEREAFFEKLWSQGGPRFVLNTYSDIMLDRAANLELYKFWRKKVRARLNDPDVANILAPVEPPHIFGGKRVSLEQDFYEQFNKTNVHIVDIKNNPVRHVDPNGIVTADGKLHELDVIALATGFDAITGGLKDIAIRGLDGKLLSDKWKMATWTYLGMMTSGYPNLMFTYGPQSPVAFSNGPSCVEPQCEWILRVLQDMRKSGLTRIESTREAETEWKRTVETFSARTLRHDSDSWYMGSNIPGKPREALVYGGGLPTYIKTIHEAIDDGYKGFQLQ